MIQVRQNGVTQVSVSLGGIPIDVPYPLFYLEALGLGIRQAFPDDPQLMDIVLQIESLLGYRLAPEAPLLQKMHLRRLESIIGWSGPEVLGQLIDREWLMTEQNELEPLERVLGSNASLASSSRILICGAGVCGLGESLSRLDHIQAIRCTDLSYLGLCFGRLLVRGEGGRLPVRLRNSRLVLTVDPRKKELRATEQECRFPSASGSGMEKMSYGVVDAFSLMETSWADLVVVPYLLDAFTAARMVTVLIRICEKLLQGQRLLLVVTASPRRDPRLVVDTLSRCGLEVLNLDLHELPYSLSSFGIGFVQTVYGTLVVEAVKREETRAGVFELAPELQDGREIEPGELFARYSLPGQRQKPFELTSQGWSSMRRALALGNYGRCRESLRQDLGGPVSEAVIAWLLSSGCLRLRFPA